jgi:hypothetical protein
MPEDTTEPYRAGAGYRDLQRVVCACGGWATTRPAIYAHAALLAHHTREHGWRMPDDELGDAVSVNLGTRNRWAA